jgi:nitrogenase molybdenum-iron protein NifN
LAFDNVTSTYKPAAIGVATTCLSETIGEDVNQMLKKFVALRAGDGPVLIPASTPSYRGSHIDGFHEAVKALVTTLATSNAPVDKVNLFPGMVSPADIRHLKELMAAFGLDYTLLPDYSDALDNPLWESYKRIPDGGTKIPTSTTCLAPLPPSNWVRYTLKTAPKWWAATSAPCKPPLLG